MNRTAPAGVRKRAPKLYDRDYIPGAGKIEVAGECMLDSDFVNYGLRRVIVGVVEFQHLRVGDIVAVYFPSPRLMGCQHAHSGA